MTAETLPAEDREFAREHAFQYAYQSPSLTADDCEEYADWYMARHDYAVGLEDFSDHSRTFSAWMVASCRI